MTTNAKVRITTFAPGHNQGRVVEVGVATMEVAVEPTQVTFRNGCYSSELATTEKPVVTLGSRRFILDRESDPKPKDILYNLSIPPDLAAKIKIVNCPCCTTRVIINL